MHYAWNFDFIRHSLGYILEGLVNTIGLALCSLAIGAVVGMVIALMRLGKLAVLRWLALAFVEFFRNTPPARSTAAASSRCRADNGRRRARSACCAGSSCA